MSPIPFGHIEIIPAAGDSSAVGISSYIARDARVDVATGARFNFRHKASDVIHHEVSLPIGAPEKLQQGAELWNAATVAETTVDRKTKKLRFKIRAQAAKHAILALPKEITDDERILLTRQFVEEQYTRHGVAVEWAIHRPEAGNENHHAHILISTRLLNETGFGRKARDLNPGFATNKRGKRFVSAQDSLTDRWIVAQNNFFQEHGLELRVDAKRLVGAVHQGPAWHLPGAEVQKKAKAADAAAAALMKDPAAILEGISRQLPTFTRRDVERVVGKHGVVGQDRQSAVDAAMSHESLLPLFDRETNNPTGRFTTKPARTRELRVIENSLKLFSTSNFGVRAADLSAAGRDLQPEQYKAVLHAVGSAGLAIIQGRAGTGKSFTLNAIRRIYDAAGYQVLGLAPTNVVVRDMAQSGFNASTIHKALFDLAHGRIRWTPKTVILVDEAGLVDTEMMERLTQAAADARCKILLTGDDRQLTSVSAGGMFAQLVSMHGAAELRQVRRQKASWQRTASESFARGDVAAGIKAYAERGQVRWHATLNDSRAALVKDWASDQQNNPNSARFVYASTNAQVDLLNAELRRLRMQSQEIEPGRRFATARGPAEVSRGDRVQFYANDRKVGIYNGILGTVTGVDQLIEVRTDAGHVVTFDPAKFNDWGLGYAGTIFRGQGKTQCRVFALHDSPFAWHARTAYVAMTRHTTEVKIYTSRDLAPDEAALARQLSRVGEDGASLNFAIEADFKKASSNFGAKLIALRRRMGLAEKPDPSLRLTAGGYGQRRAPVKKRKHHMPTLRRPK